MLCDLRLSGDRLFLMAVLCWLVPLSVIAAVPPDFVDEVVADGFQAPTDVAIAPDGRLFVAEKQGLVWVVENGSVLTTPFIDLIDEVGNAHDRGLLGIALDPDFAQNGYVYLLYVVDQVFGQPDESGGSVTFGRLTRYTAIGNTADPNSRLVLLGNDASDGFPHCHKSHAIGTVRFANDGTLFVGSGDGAHFDFTDGGQNVTADDPDCEALFGDAQDLGAYRSQLPFSLGGKIVRIDPATGLGLPDNPFYTGDPAAIESRVWVLGLRNQFRFTVRSGTPGPGTLYIGDVGWSTWEELNVAPLGGENFGWPCYEGVPQHNGYMSHSVVGPLCQELSSAEVTEPMIAWHHSDPGTLGFVGNAAAGAAFYEGVRFPPLYRGQCFFADYGRDWIKVARVDENNQLLGIEDFADALANPVDLEYNPHEESLLYVSISAGEVRRIRFTLDNVAPVASAAATPEAGSTPLLVQFSSDGTFDPDGDPVVLNWDFGDGSAPSTAANPDHVYTNVGSFTATLTVTDDHTNSAQDSVFIDSFNEPPTVTITNPLDGYQFFDGEFVQFQAQASDVEDGTNLFYHWEIQLVHDNHVHPEVMVSDESEPPPFELAGHGDTDDRISYLAIVSVMDSVGLEATDSIRVLPLDLPPNDPPVARFFADPVEGDPPLLVSLDATGSEDPNGDLLLYDWSFGDGAAGSGVTATHIFDAPGTYDVTLTVTDVLGATDTTTVPIQVRNTGLQGDYYDDKDLSSLALTRIDPVVDFEWGTGSPAPGIDNNTFSARWTGRVKPLFSETYTFYTVTDDGVRLWVDGQLLVDRWVDQSPKEWSGTIDLQAGVPYDLEMEYYENQGGAVARILWSSSSQLKEVIPESRLLAPLGPPAVHVLAPADGATIAGDTAHVSYSAGGDLSEVDHITLSVNGAAPIALAGLNGIHTLSGLSPGAYNLTLTLRRGDGTALTNPEATADVSFDVSNPPTVQLTQPASGATSFTSDVAVTYEVGGYLGEADHLHLNLDGEAAVTLPVADGSHTFTDVALGEHTVSIEIAGSDHLPLPNPEASDAVTFTVAEPPTVTILSPADGSVVTGETVTVDFTSTGDLTEVDHVHVELDGQNLVMVFDLDGSHTYTNVAPGSHDARATLVRADHTHIGNPESVDMTIFEVVELNVPPVAVITADPLSGPSPLEVTLDGTASTDANAGDVLTYHWDLDDDGLYDDSAEPVLSHSFLTAGQHTVGLEVRDAAGASSTTSALFTVDNTLPTAVLGADPIIGPVPLEVSLDASGSSDPDPGDVLTYGWDLDGDGFYDDAAAEVLTHTFAQTGTHSVGLQVVDSNGGTDDAHVEITVQNTTPTAALAAAPPSGPAVLSVVLDASGSFDPDPGQTLTYAWDLNDDAAYDDGVGAGLTNLFSEVGDHTVSVEVRDGHGGVDTASTLITVSNSPPVADVLTPLSTATWKAGESIAFAGEAVDPSDGLLPPSALSWEVLFHSCDPGQPDDCQVQTLFAGSGVGSGVVTAPAHLEPPARLEFRLTATDGDPTWWNANWTRRRTLTFDNAEQAESLVDFPVLIRLDASRIDYAQSLPDGADLRFVDADGTLLPHEVESWNPGGDSYVWVRVPQIDGASETDFIWLYYGNAAATDVENPEAVWNAGYAAVWHLHDDLGDSTTNGLDGANNGSTGGAGRIAGGRAFDGVDDYVRIDDAPPIGFSASEDFTLSAWVFVPALPNQWSGVMAKYSATTFSPWYGVWIAPWNVWVSGVQDNGHLFADPVTTGWHHLCVVQDAAAGTRTLYLDGVNAGATTAQAADGPEPLHLGATVIEANEHFEGSIDEVRIASAARSPDWIVAQIRSMEDSFISVGPDEQPQGLSDTAVVELLPETVALQFDTVPSGLSLTVAGQELSTPAERTFIVDGSFTLSAPMEQIVNDTRYRFVSWSDGGDRSHEVVAGGASPPFTATYEEVADSPWTKRRKLVIDNTSQTQSLLDFPLLVTLDPGRIDYAAMAPDGADLRFTDPDGTLLPYEIEAWNPGGDSYVWVRVPQIDGASAADFIWMYYGNPDALEGQDASAVWAGFAAVWHLHDDLSDATGNQHDGLNAGSSDTVGIAGDAQSFDGVDDFIQVAHAPDLGFGAGEDFSLSAWVLVPSLPGQWAGIVSKYSATTFSPWYGVWATPGDQWLMGMHDNNHLFGSSITPGWHQVSVVQDVSAGTRSFYVDGVLQGTRPAQSADGSDPLYIGATVVEPGEHFGGAIDEVRIAPAAWSADWIAAEQRSVTDSFVSFGAEESVGDWWDPDWGRRRNLTFNNGQQGEDLNHIPVLVRLDDTRVDYSQTQPDGADLRFLDPDGTVLAHELESWNPGGDSFVWVRVPRVDAGSNGDSIWMYYGNPTVSDAQDPAAVWSEGYEAVWHMNGDLADATGHGHTGVNHGSATAAGLAASARAFDGVDDYVEVPHAPGLAFAATDSFSIGAWVFLPALPGKWTGIVTKYSAATFSPWYGIWTAPWNAYLFGASDNNHLFGGSAQTGWHYVAIVQDGPGNERALYVDGVRVGTSTAKAADGADPLYIGGTVVEANEYLDGLIDEVRVSHVARSDAWIAAQQLVATDGFITFGAEEEQGSGFGANLKVAYDYDGDAVSDVAAYSSGEHAWEILLSNAGQPQLLGWGAGGAVPVPADYDGDGRTDPAVYRPSDGMWFFFLSRDGERQQQFGWSAALPVPADYDGDGVTDIAVYWPEGGMWYILRSTEGFEQQQFGWSESIPVPADYDGDGRADPGVYWPAGGMWYLLESSQGFRQQQFGWSEAEPFPADYDGDGKADLGVYWPEGGMWYLMQSRDGFKSQQFGWSESVPVPADYNGDGIEDCAVYWPGGNTCYILEPGGDLRIDQLDLAPGASPAHIQCVINAYYR